MSDLTTTETNIHDTPSKLARFIGASENQWWQALGPFIFIGFFSLFFSSVYMGIALTLSMLLHELGHAYFFERYTIIWKLLWLFPLGAGVMPANKKENEASNKISWWKLSWLMTAGPTVNIVLMCIGLGMVASGILAPFGQALVTINGSLLAFNLIPWGPLDAGQLFKLVFSSLNERSEYYLMGSIFVACLLFWGLIVFLGHANILLTIFLNIGWVLTTIVILITLVISSRKDDEAHASSPLAMSSTQATVATCFYFFLVVATLLLWTGLPVLIF